VDVGGGSAEPVRQRLAWFLGVDPVEQTLYVEVSRFQIVERA
jgi:hypothetical protein